MKTTFLLGTALLAFASPVSAEVKTKADNGFSVLHSADVDAAPDVIWKRLITPKEYWSKAHSWSGSVAGFTLDPRPGGCFCEAMQEPLPGGKFKNIGNVEHMRVIFAQPGKVLRMQGALGPLQSEAMLGTLTVAIAPAKSGTGSTVSFSYVAGGYMRYKPTDIAAVVDKVIGEQFASLIAPFVPQIDADMTDAKTGVKNEVKPTEWSLDVENITGAKSATGTPETTTDGMTAVDGALDDMKVPPADAPKTIPVKPKPKPKAGPEDTR